ncbi:MAG: S8 family serine peptidase [Burkholderiaceae bacterium]
MNKPLLARSLCMLWLLCLPALAAAPATGEGVNAPRRAAVAAEHPDRARVIVKYRADGALMRESALAAGTGGEARVAHASRMAQRLGLAMSDGHAVAPRTQVLHAQGLSSNALVERLRADPDVEAAWVDERVYASRVPNDSRYAGGQVAITPAVGQWYLRTPDASLVSAINAPAAWDLTQGSAAIVVADVDTGVRGDHPDLAGKLLPGYDFVSEDGPGDFSTANDGDGRDADPSDPGDWITSAEAGKGAFASCTTAQSSSWHGTQTAGLIGAVTDNATGMASVGWNVRVLPVRALGKCGGYLSDVVAAIRWAAGVSSDPVANPNPARVINLSLGSSGACAGSLYESAIAEVIAAGVTVVAAAGNENGLAAGKPANCAGVIGVAGLRQTGSKVGYSNIGPELSVAAPAGNCINGTGQCLYPLLTTTNAGTKAPAANTYSDGIDASIGTSFSSPLVAGTAALMLSANPSMTPAQVRSAIRSTARAFPTTGGTAGTTACVAPGSTEQLECYCTTSTCGAGMLDAAAAVAQAAATRVTAALAYASPGAPTPGATVTLDGSSSVAAPTRSISSYAWTMRADGGIATLQGATNASTVSMSTSGAGSFTVRLTVTDSAGTTATKDVTIAVANPAVSSGGSSSSGGGGALSPAWLLGLLIAAASLRRRA